MTNTAENDNRTYKINDTTIYADGVELTIDGQGRFVLVFHQGSGDDKTTLAKHIVDGVKRTRRVRMSMKVV